MNRFVCLAALAVVLGCDRKPAAPPAPRLSPAPAPVSAPVPVALAAPVLTPVVVPGGPPGALSGTVKLLGTPPPLRTIAMSVPYCSSQWPDKPPVHEDVVLGPGQELANVLVHITRGVPAGASPVPAFRATLDQRKCLYAPHVVAMRAGQELEVVNSDGDPHNVNILSVVNPLFNRMQPAGAPPLLIQRSQPELGVRVKCDIHPWMSAVLHVLDHPHFQLTGLDGTFTLPDLPPGEYELEARHEIFGTARATVTLRDTGQQVHFLFSAR